MISIEPRGDDLEVLTGATRREAEIAAIGGVVTQVWTWRNGEAAVVREWSPSGYPARWAVVVRCGLRAGKVRIVHANSIAEALRALGISYRIRSARRRPAPIDPTSTAGRRRRLLRSVRRRGNTWRTMRARLSPTHEREDQDHEHEEHPATLPGAYQALAA